MAYTNLSLAVFVALLSYASVQALTCYQCTGISGEFSGVYDTYNYNPQDYQHCGLPFNDNTTDKYTRLPTVECEGVCVTNTVFQAGAHTSHASTMFYRSCTDVPVEDGCEYYNSGGLQQWSCIKTCTSDLCNKESSSANLIPSTVFLLMSAVGALARLAAF
jgi:hypothetical protein